MKPDIFRRKAVCVQAAMLFDYTLDFHTNDFRQYPELYRVGWGEQGVLLVQPYKAEILPH